MARATSSLPVPVAPVTKTALSLGATRSMTEKSLFIAGDWPTRIGRALGVEGDVTRSNRSLGCCMDELIMAVASSGRAQRYLLVSILGAMSGLCAMIRKALTDRIRDLSPEAKINAQYGGNFKSQWSSG